MFSPLPIAYVLSNLQNNLGDFMPDNADTIAQQVTGVSPESDAALDAHNAAFEALQAKYGGVGQTVLGGLEGGAQGVLGPIAPALEEATGLTTGKDIRGRAAASPLVHGSAEAATFLGSMALPGPNLLKGVGKAGEIAGEVASHIAPEIPKIAATGIKTGAEMAALATSDELTKMVTGDPNQTIGTAAVNVGLSGLLGGVTGAGIGTVSNLFSTGKRMLTDKFISDSMGETGFLQQAAQDTRNELGYLNSNPNQVTTAGAELSGRMDEAAQMTNMWKDMKPEVLNRALPEPTPENTATIDAHVADLSRELEGKLSGAPQVAQDAYQTFQQESGTLPPPALPELPSMPTLEADPTISKLKAQLDAFQNKKMVIEADSNFASKNFDVGDPRRLKANDRFFAMRDQENKLLTQYKAAVDNVSQKAAGVSAVLETPALAPLPSKSFSEKYLALNKFKQETASWAKWAYQSPEHSALGQLGRDLSNPVRAMLEDPEIWGGAADVQRVSNAATKEAIDAGKAFSPQITTMGQVDPVKVNALLNQANAGKISRKANVVGAYLEKTQELADVINKVHLDNGLDSPLAAKLNPTPTLDHALNTPLTPGVKFARWAHAKGAESIAGALGRAGGGTLGGAAGFLAGHPLAGTWAGEKVLGPVFAAMAKPFLERPINALGAKAAVDYVAQASRGLSALKEGVSRLFTPGAEILGKHTLPSQSDRDSLQKSLDAMQDPDKAVKMAPLLGEYLPAHKDALGMTAGAATTYFASLKPTSTQASPMDTPTPHSVIAQKQYNRALDIAQKPLMVLQHIKDGTLLPGDIQTLQTLYPALHGAMIQHITAELTKPGVTVPYAQRTSLNTFVGGKPLDSTMTPYSRQAIVNSISLQQQTRANQQHQNQPKRASGVMLKQMNKVNDMSMTKLEQRQSGRR
jgi:hypothetical protein